MRQSGQPISSDTLKRIAHTTAAYRQDAIVEGSSYREQHGMRLLESIRQDCRLGVRSLQRAPGVAVSVILTLMLGIGANTVLFSVIFAVLFRPLPYRDADQLVWIGESGNSKRAGYELVIIQ